MLQLVMLGTLLLKGMSLSTYAYLNDLGSAAALNAGCNYAEIVLFN